MRRTSCSRPQPDVDRPYCVNQIRKSPRKPSPAHRSLKDQAETFVLFELISARYERRSLLITANQPFGEWGKVFPDPAMTLAAVDRLVHHATIFEMNVESYRRRAATLRRAGPGRPPTRATIIENDRLSRSDNQPDAQPLPASTNHD